MPRAARADLIAKPCDEVFEKLGASVAKLDRVGKGFPDRLVGIWGQTHVVEYKTGSKVPSARRLSEDQKKWHQWWKGSPVVIIFSPEHAREWALRVRGEL